MSASSMVFSRRFFPLFWVQFLGALNDNVFKNAMVMLLTFRLAETPSDAGLMITLAAGLFILPFFLFSAFAGQLADRYDKTTLIRKIKLAEILIMISGALAFFWQDILALFVVLFFMGTQSAFFGPIKYSILPEHLTKEELTKGNGWFSGSTFLAILLGTIIGGLIVLNAQGPILLSIIVIALAMIGYLASLWIPPSKGEHRLIVYKNFLRSTWREVKEATRFPHAFFSVLAISWFWFLGATYLSQMPVMVKDYIHGDDTLVVVFLAVFAIGIAVGAAWVSRNNKTYARIYDLSNSVWWLIGMSVAMMISTGLLAWNLPVANTTVLPLSWQTAWQDPLALGLLISMALIAVFGGLFIVPLYTVLQLKTPEEYRSRMVAVNNITNALFMVVSSLLIMALYAFGANLWEIFSIIAVLNLVIAWWYFTRIRSFGTEEGESEWS